MSRGSAASADLSVVLMVRNGHEPWWAAAGQLLLTERGLSTLLTLVLVGALLIGGGRLLSDMIAVGHTQVAQQERLITRLDEAQATLLRIELLLRAQALGERIDNARLQLTGIDAQLDRVEELVRAAGRTP
jgi:hypothetical protein